MFARVKFHAGRRGAILIFTGFYSVFFIVGGSARGVPDCRSRGLGGVGEVLVIYIVCSIVAVYQQGPVDQRRFRPLHAVRPEASADSYNAATGASFGMP